MCFVKCPQQFDTVRKLAGCSIAKLCLASDLQTLSVWAAACGDENRSFLVEVDTSRLWQKREELGCIATQLEAIGSLVMNSQRIVNSMHTQVTVGILCPSLMMCFNSGRTA